ITLHPIVKSYISCPVEPVEPVRPVQRGKRSHFTPFSPLIQLNWLNGLNPVSRGPSAGLTGQPTIEDALF
ncbi:MAG: hypothetical protein PVJ37_01595, partial [Desulfobacterales bacterium]